MLMAPRRWICVALVAVAVAIGVIHGQMAFHELAEHGTGAHAELAYTVASADDGLAVAATSDSRRLLGIGLALTSTAVVASVSLRRRGPRLAAPSRHPAPGTTGSIGLRAPPHPLLT
jgi:hypothetical protein